MWKVVCATELERSGSVASAESSSETGFNSPDVIEHAEGGVDVTDLGIIRGLRLEFIETGLGEGPDLRPATSTTVSDSPDDLLPDFDEVMAGEPVGVRVLNPWATHGSG